MIGLNNRFFGCRVGRNGGLLWVSDAERSIEAGCWALRYWRRELRKRSASSRIFSGTHAHLTVNRPSCLGGNLVRKRGEGS
jgi:hypothetical protein